MEFSIIFNAYRLLYIQTRASLSRQISTQDRKLLHCRSFLGFSITSISLWDTLGGASTIKNPESINDSLILVLSGVWQPLSERS